MESWLERALDKQRARPEDFMDEVLPFLRWRVGRATCVDALERAVHAQVKRVLAVDGSLASGPRTRDRYPNDISLSSSAMFKIYSLVRVFIAATS